MDKIYAENYGISGVDRVTPLRKACPVSPKTPEYRDRSLEKDCGLFLFHQRLSYKFSGKTEWTYPLGIAKKDDDLSHHPALLYVSRNKQSLTSRKQRLVNTIIDL